MYPKIHNTIFTSLFLLFLQLLAGLAIYFLLGKENEGLKQNYSVTLVNSFSFLLVTLYAFYRTKFPLINIKLENKEQIRFLLLSVLVTFPVHILGFLFASLVFQNSSIAQSISNQVAQAFPADQIPLILLLVIVAPITEELFFRGFIFSGLRKQYSVKTAMITSTLLFALFHINPPQILSAFAVGLYICFIYATSNNILFPILIHSVYNGLAILLPYLVNALHLHESNISLNVGWYTLDLIDLTGFVILIIGVPFLLRSKKILDDALVETDST